MTIPESIPTSATPQISGYTILDRLYLGSRTVVYRAIQTAQQRSVAIKVLRRDYPSFSELVQFRNQYTIAKNLPLPGIVQPLSLEPFGNGYVLVMEDGGGVSLEQYLQHQSWDVAEVLAIALQLAEILHALHQHQVVHKDIKPANILIHPESKQVKLIDFSISSLLPKETQEIQSPNVLEGTLAYLAPEQTGRMNRGIDYRADFYALGVTLYQLLSGKLPFESDDPMELLHCHIAKVPVPVERVNPRIPTMVAAIVTKLMAKNAEERYQSALGLKHDLEQCLMQWDASGEIQAFELGQRDLCDRFLIPEKLYGRDGEVKTLLDAFERVANGSTELMLVAGFSGIGKTAVVNEVHKPITRQNGYFIKGKFDQFNRNIPLSAFVQAFRDLMGQLLCESDTRLAQWKTEILTALGDNGQVLIDAIPELEQILGKQPPAPELSGTAAQNRFNLLFQKFIQVFTTPEHPFVIFLDDLQWADSASLQLMKVLMNGNGYLLMLGAYRDNEVSPTHPSILMVEELKKAEAIVHTIILNPLAIEDTNALIAETLHCSLELALSLTQLVERKTKGNPFFTTQFLKALYEDGYITFNGDRGYWECDLAQIKTLSLTDDVVEFMALQLQKLPAQTQQILKLAACVGNPFDLATLAIISEQSPTEAATALWRTLQEGLIVPTSQSYKFFQSQNLEQTEAENRVNPVYRFLHDRVQQAAYSLIAPEEKQSTHLLIGQLLQQNLSEIEQEERLFDIVGHLNLGKELLAQPEEREALARSNLAAAQKAKNSTAYAAARSFVQTGLELLADNCWQEQYDLTLNLHVAAAEIAYLNGDFEEMECRAKQVLDAAKTVLDKVEVYITQINALTTQKNQMAEAISVGTNALAQLGVEFSDRADLGLSEQALQDLAMQLQGKEIEDLVNLPIMTDPQTVAVMKLLAIVFAPIFAVNPALLPLLCSQMVRLSLQFGNTSVSTIGYVVYGMVLANFCGEVERGYRFGKMALSLLDRFNAPEYRTQTVLVFSAFLQHRQEAMQDTIPLMKEGYLSGMEMGNFLYAGYNIVNHFYSCLFSGLCLTDWEPELDKYRVVLVRVKQDAPVVYLKMTQQVVQNLVTTTSQSDVLIGTAYDESKMLPEYFQDNDPIELGSAYIYKVMLAYLFGRYTHALDYIDKIRPYLSAIAGLVYIPVFHFYAGLTYLRVATTQLDAEQSQALNRAEEHRTTLSEWAYHAPMNHQHKVDLLKAEKCRVLGKYYEAGDKYDRAIAGAKENGFIPEEALANELAAKFYLDWGKEKVAAGYLQEAYYCYARWGAKAKVEDLERRYPQLLRPLLQAAIPTLNPLETLASVTAIHAPRASSTKNPTSSSTSINAMLDLAAVLKASQILASTIQLDELLHQLTQIILQHSGGDLCALILPNTDGEWQVRAIAKTEFVELCTEPLEGNPELPVPLIQYVKRTREAVVVNDCKTDLPVIGEYLRRERPKSVSCLPIRDRGNLIGMLYLQNQNTSNVFADDRLLILNFLCTQAAISLENARLYQQAQTYARQLEQSQLQIVQSEKMASLGNLVAGVAHEINNPLGFLNGSISNLQISFQEILGHLELYEQHYPNPVVPIEDNADEIELEFLSKDVPILLNSMKGATDRITAISTSLRIFSRADTEYPVQANLHEGLDSTLLILKYRLKANENRPAIQVIREYGDLPAIDCYPGQMNQVFMNILANAIDALDESNTGRSFEEIQANPNRIIIQTEAPGESVIVRIADNGQGMALDLKQRIFEHGFTTKVVGKGTGLGLAIARQIVEDGHGGAIAVRSHLGEGTEFEIILPLGKYRENGTLRL